MAKIKKPTEAPKAPKIDIFASAKSTPQVSDVKSSKGKDRFTINFGAELDQLAAIEVLIDSLEGLGGQLKSALRERAYDEFTEQNTKAKKHSSSFVATGEHAQASVEVRRRGSNMPINDDVVLGQLQAAGVPLEKKIKVPERFVFNHAHLQNQDIRDALQEALMSHPKLKAIAGSLIERQEEEFTWSPSQETLQVAAATMNPDTYRNLVPFLTTLAIGKWHLDGEATKQGTGEEKSITPGAKSAAIGMLQEMGVLPIPEKQKEFG